MGVVSMERCRKLFLLFFVHFFIVSVIAGCGSGGDSSSSHDSGSFGLKTVKTFIDTGAQAQTHPTGSSLSM